MAWRPPLPGSWVEKKKKEERAGSPPIDEFCVRISLLYDLNRTSGWIRSPPRDLSFLSRARMGIKTITTVGQPIYPRFATVSIGHIAFSMITRDPTSAPWKQTRGTEAESASGQW